MSSRSSLSLRVETGRSGGSRRHRYSGEAGTSSSPFPPGSALDRIARLVSENAVIIFGFNGCCMCHVARQLLSGMGVNPTLYELDEEEDGGSKTEDALVRIAGRDPAVPAVFIGGKFVGGVERLMSIHIKGNLVPMLKDAGALWL
ncbi:glutaredoxin-C1-like [Nymphaea colorata]|nr:glutaredoxin-C1-like [Nymphaea colorata]XP_031483750.1 glutaredoxin-C1-like [Nymphaea colorata]